jgi:hypothetical protein
MSLAPTIPLVLFALFHLKFAIIHAGAHHRILCRARAVLELRTHVLERSVLGVTSPADKTPSRIIPRSLQDNGLPAPSR